MKIKEDMIRDDMRNVVIYTIKSRWQFLQKLLKAVDLT